MGTIRCNLSTLMGARRLRIADVHRETKIARNTLSSLYHDQTERFDRDVLAKLCAFLECQPGDLLEYVPDEAPGEAEVR